MVNEQAVHNEFFDHAHCQQVQQYNVAEMTRGRGRPSLSTGQQQGSSGTTRGRRKEIESSVQRDESNSSAMSVEEVFQTAGQLVEPTRGRRAAPARQFAAHLRYERTPPFSTNTTTSRIPAPTLESPTVVQKRRIHRTTRRHHKKRVSPSASVSSISSKSQSSDDEPPKRHNNNRKLIESLQKQLHDLSVKVTQTGHNSQAVFTSAFDYTPFDPESVVVDDFHQEWQRLKNKTDRFHSRGSQRPARATEEPPLPTSHTHQVLAAAANSNRMRGKWVDPDNIPILSFRVEDFDWWFRQIQTHLMRCCITEPNEQMYYIHTYSDDEFRHTVLEQAKDENITPQSLYKHVEVYREFIAKTLYISS